ncbi:hypothetical protein [Polaribacter sp. NJDZ03]|uniref:hypothetical protein n=1 Tax=Polaribacter sp. NJDZ03 TaxID=2855841 RepID=UPI001C4A0531|nr:hypothetical protein [Polaribacter sp. NJDZ03]
MKTNLLTYFICLCSIISFGQKKEIYINDDLVKITKSEFNKEKDLHKSYNMRFELDTLIVNVKVQRVKKGQVSKIKLDSIRNELSTVSDQNIPENNILIINYYHGLDRCNSTGDKSYVRGKYKNYLRKLKKLKNVNQFFMYKSHEGTVEYGKQLNWIKDKSGTIEKTFLPIHYPCGSFVIIDENGNFYIQKGEYNIENIIDLIKNKKKTFANTVYN